jgi:hypothetical protein
VCRRSDYVEAERPVLPISIGTSSLGSCERRDPINEITLRTQREAFDEGQSLQRGNREQLKVEQVVAGANPICRG